MEGQIDKDLLIKLVSSNNQQLKASFFQLLTSSYMASCEQFYTPIQNYVIATFKRLGKDSKRIKLLEGNNSQDIILSTGKELLLFTFENNWNFSTSIEEPYNKIKKLPKPSVQTLVISKELWEKEKKHPISMIHYKKLRNHVRHIRETNKPFLVLYQEELQHLVAAT